MILPTGTWGELDFFKSGEWQVIEERLQDLKVLGRVVNPEKKNLFRALKETPFEKVKVVILGQDPYPSPEDACGIAFSSPAKRIPPTLDQIFKEYCSDLHYPRPTSGDLTPWCKEGVLLWNVIPTCEAYKSLSHYVDGSWDEWSLLTEEILDELSKETSTIFVAFGSIPRKYMDKYVQDEDSVKLYVSHPSPRAGQNSKHPFLGSRIFSTINDKLTDMGLSPVNWKLP